MIKIDYKMVKGLDILEVTKFYMDNDSNPVDFEQNFGIEILDGEMEGRCFQFTVIRFVWEHDIEFKIMKFNNKFESIDESEISSDESDVYGTILVDLLKNGIESHEIQEAELE